MGPVSRIVSPVESRGESSVKMIDCDTDGPVDVQWANLDYYNTFKKNRN